MACIVVLLTAYFPFTTGVAMRILLIKTSSLGDVIHNLPVVTDILGQFPHAIVDWVVEENFADIPRLHPAVNQVIPVAIRRWRKALFTTDSFTPTRREICAFRQKLRAQTYDAIIDTQGLLKSALLTAQGRGPRHGMDKASAREPFAAHFYTHPHHIPRDVHAVTRNRQLAALSLGYALANDADYGLRGAATASIVTETKTVVLLTATSRDDKLWPEPQWIALGQHVQRQGYVCQLPAGSARERERAARIAAHIPDAAVVPPSSIAELAAVLGSAHAVIGVDTGLVHLAAALGRPTLALYCASAPGLTGVMADRHSRAGAINLGGPGQTPATQAVIEALDSLL